jgi:putative transposase
MEILCFYAIGNQNVMHFLTFTVIDWVDIFSRKIYRDIVNESLKLGQKSKGVNFRYNCSSNSKSFSKIWI